MRAFLSHCVRHGGFPSRFFAVYCTIHIPTKLYQTTAARYGMGWPCVIISFCSKAPIGTGICASGTLTLLLTSTALQSAYRKGCDLWKLRFILVCVIVAKKSSAAFPRRDKLSRIQTIVDKCSRPVASLLFSFTFPLCLDRRPTLGWSTTFIWKNLTGEKKEANNSPPQTWGSDLSFEMTSPHSSTALLKCVHADGPPAR